MDCLFCQIIKGKIPSQKVFEDAHCFAFRDIQPMAPIHVLIVPKEHAEGLHDLSALSDEALGACLRAAERIAKQEGLENGYRLISNCGKDSCQTVQHLHFHLLGGKPLSERMD